MPFLQLNGVTIPVRDPGSSREPIEVGETGRSVGGLFARTRRAFRRRWKFRTPPIAPDQAEALAGLIRGRGLALPFRGSLVAANGLQPLAGSVATLRYLTTFRGEAVGGAEAYSPGIPGLGAAVAVDDTTTNILPAAMANASSVAQFAGVNGGLLSAAQNPWQPLGCVKATTPAGINGLLSGISTVPVATIPGTAYRGAMYVKALSAAMQLKAYLYVASVPPVTSVAVVRVLQPNVWTRFDNFGLTVPVGGGTASIFVTEVVETAAAEEFAVDGLQLEAKTHTTSWIPGTTSRGAGALQYGAQAARTLTGTYSVLMFATRHRAQSGPRYLFHAVSSGGVSDYPSLDLRIGIAADIDLLARDAAGTLTAINVPSFFTTIEQWRLVAAVVRPSPSAGFHKIELYSGGVLIGFADPTDTPDLGTLGAALHIGNTGSPGQEYSGAVIDDVMVLPYAATPELLAAFAAAGPTYEKASAPLLWAAGSFFDDLEMPVRAVIDEIAFEPFQGGTQGFQDSGRAIAFTLEEA